MPLAVPLTQAQVDAAGRTHARLRQWQMADRVLESVREQCPSFGLEAVLLKVIAVDCPAFTPP